MVKIRTMILLTLLSFLAGGCQQEKEVQVIKLAHGLDMSHPVHLSMEFMAERLDEKSGGTMKIEIYPNQQLGTEREALELLQIGSLGMTKVSTAVLENFAPKLKVFGLPFIFRDNQHRLDVLKSDIGQELLNESVRNRLKGLTFYDAGSRSFYAKQPVRTPEDLEGLKLRVMESKTSMDMVSYLGGSPTPISWGELYTALQQGIVDGAENNLPSFHLSRHYEICKYFVLDQHTSIPDELIISTIIWDQLSPQQQKWLKEAADESFEYQIKVWDEAVVEARNTVEAAGVQIIEPENKEEFVSKVQPMYEEFKEDPEMRELIESIQAFN